MSFGCETKVENEQKKIRLASQLKRDSMQLNFKAIPCLSKEVQRLEENLYKLIPEAFESIRIEQSFVKMKGIFRVSNISNI